METYVITASPSDFPGLFVCRQHVDGKATEAHWTGASIEEVERLLPPGFVEGPLLPEDDPTIRKWFVRKEALQLAEAAADAALKESETGARVEPLTGAATRVCHACSRGDHSGHVAQLARICIGCACPERPEGVSSGPLPPGVKMVNIPLFGWRVPQPGELEVLGNESLPEGTEIYVCETEDEEITLFLTAFPGKPVQGIARFWAYNKTVDFPEHVCRDLIQYSRPPGPIDARGFSWLEGLRQAHRALPAHKLSQRPFVATISGHRWVLWTDGHIVLAGPTDAPMEMLNKSQRGARDAIGFLFPEESLLQMEASREELLEWARGFRASCNVDGICFQPRLVAEAANRLDGDVLRVTRPSNNGPWVLLGATRRAAIMPVNMPVEPLLARAPLREATR